MKEESIDESIITVKIRAAVTAIIGLVIATNFATTVLLSIASNSNQIEYNNGREQRRINHMKAEMQYEIKINHLESELKKCKTVKK